MSLGLKSLTQVKMPRAITSRSIFTNRSSTLFNQDEYVGVK
jgi:hypothetical protein